MRFLFSLLILSMTSPAWAEKRRSGSADSENLKMWDGSEADVGWVSENPTPPARRRAVVPSFRPWFSLVAGGGHRFFTPDTPMVQEDENQTTLSQGRFSDLIETKNALEVRALFHPFRFLSLGAIYHRDEALLKISEEQGVTLNPEELSGTVQLGPRFGFVRVYAFYNHIIRSRSQASIGASTRVNDATALQVHTVDVKQTGADAGLGTQINFGSLGIFAEATQSLKHSYDVSIAAADQTRAGFHATAQPSFKAWHLGLSLDI